MRRNPIVLAWVAGLALAAAVYVVGPERLVFRLLDNLHLLGWWLAEVVAHLSDALADGVRALAIGLYVTFVALALAVLQRGGPARAALFWVSVLFWLLAVGAIGLEEGPGRWVLALALVTIAAIGMTARLRAPRPAVPSATLR